MEIKTPAEIYGQLFIDIHRSGLWADGKRISDLIPLRVPEEILQDYLASYTASDFDLRAFVESNFSYTEARNSGFVSDTSKSVEEHIETLWDYLLRDADEAVEGSSLIPLPHPYIVPGGRFQEIYYWDSYFTMLGLAASGRIDTIESMIRNFAHLIDQLGHIPNGNRSYFTGRSQPPFFACMIELLAAHRGPEVLVEFLPYLLREYDFWIDGVMELSNGKPLRRLARAGEAILNRHWDRFPDPRSEMYSDDVELQEQSGRHGLELFTDLRAACESGWDFSSRWFVGGDDLAATRASKIIPVDLNCLLYKLEQVIARAAGLSSDAELAETFIGLAEMRAERIREHLWNPSQGVYTDFNTETQASMGRITAGAAYPLFFKIASDEEAASTAAVIERDLLKAGGIVTTTVNSGQQWDAPNGWAPLQWVTIQGLRNYGFNDLASEARARWIALNTRVYKETGKLLEKYDVVDLSKTSGGGEYPVQDGFGWTNGVLLALIREEG